MEIRRSCRNVDEWRAAGYWGAHHADDDTLRWSFMLMRHYCIEGRTEPLSARYGLSYAPGNAQEGEFLGVNFISIRPYILPEDFR